MKKLKLAKYILLFNLIVTNGFCMEIEISSRNVRLGEVLTILAKNADTNNYTLWLDETPYPLYPAGTNTLRAFIGFDFEFKTRNCKVNISPGRVFKTRSIEKNKNKVLAKALFTETENQIWEGNFILPLKGRISGRYGEKRLYKKNTGGSFLTWKGVHGGLDITTGKHGSPIITSNSGNIILARHFLGEGNTVVIDHGQGVITTYFHLQKIFVKEGSFVKKGETIGTTGSTGLANGPHLHFGVYIHGIPIDPLFWVSFRG